MAALSNGEARRRLAACAATTRSIHEESISSPHWYLSNLAITPDAQGKGVGKILLNALQRLCVSDNVPCYLETIGARNESIYRKVGYEVKVKRTIEPGKGMTPCDWNGGAAGMVRQVYAVSKL